MTQPKPLSVDCDRHGRKISAVVCCHMIGPNARPVGFIENKSEPNDRQAWCYACEEKFEEEGEMTQAFHEFNNMRLVCIACYAEIRSRHTLPSQ